MKRIFYYSGYRLTVFQWHKEKLVARYAFNPGEQGIDKFRAYLLATDNIPTRILVDLIEEDFKKETVPHVGRADRKSIVSRLVERHYRKSKDYTHSFVLGRNSHGRKDDILLYSVLSNPDILEQWLKPVRDTQTAISGIWSLPLLSHRLFNKLDIKAANAILVSQQVPSNIRQSFFKNGKFQTSRSAVINLEEASIGEYISTEVDQTIRFLSNQRQVGFDEKIDIYILCRSSDLLDIKEQCSNTNLFQYHFHTIESINTLFSCNTENIDNCSDINSYICACEKIPVGHYGNRSLFFNFYQHQATKALYALSFLIFIFSFIFSFSLFSQSISITAESKTLLDKTKQINIQYSDKLSHLEKKLAQTKMMKSSVLFSERVSSTKTISPQNFMVDVSKILMHPDINNTRITNIKWRLTQSSKLPSASTNLKTQLIDYANKKSIHQFASIGGYLQLSQSSLSKSVATTDAISAAFKNSKKTVHIDINKVPVDVRPQSSIENETGLSNKKKSSLDQTKGRFELNVLMQGRAN